MVTKMMLSVSTGVMPRALPGQAAIAGVPSRMATVTCMPWRLSARVAAERAADRSYVQRSYVFGMLVLRSVDVWRF